MNACVIFNYTCNTTRKGQNVNAILPVYRNATAWCNYIYSRISRSFSIPAVLPAGMLLIRRDRAWGGGIPSKLNGRPCSLGRITLLTPDTNMIHSKRLTITDTGLSGWLASLGITGWLKDLLMHGLVILIVILAVVMIVPRIIKIVERMIAKAFHVTWLAQKTKRGNCGRFHGKWGTFL